MSDLKRKGEEWQSKMIKAVVFFAVMGCVVLVCAIYFLAKTFGDLSTAITGADTPATTTQTSK